MQWTVEHAGPLPGLAGFDQPGIEYRVGNSAGAAYQRQRPEDSGVVVVGAKVGMIGKHPFHGLVAGFADGLVLQQQLQRVHRQLHLQLRSEQGLAPLLLPGLEQQLAQCLRIAAANVQFAYQRANVGFVHPFRQSGATAVLNHYPTRG
ncbi:hypothetical protein D3C77_597840 [compost metagenome]